MSVEVLKAKEDIDSSRSRLLDRGISCLALEIGRRSRWQRLLGTGRRTLGDAVKSWDVLRTVEYLERAYPRSARVLDIGAFNSEVLCVLHRLGFERLTGVDLNPAIRDMPLAEAIRYEVGNFLHTPFPEDSFDVVTAISVIEHGFEGPALLTELSRILAPGGSFVASVDYWPEKIDTSNQKFFGMDWRIFSRDELGALVALAADYGFAPEGTLALEAGEPTIHCADRDYTFAWLALKKRRA